MSRALPSPKHGGVGAAAALALAASLAACQTAKPSDSALTHTLQHAAITESMESRLLGACGISDPVADRARSSISSWYQVVGFLDECDLPRIRYYVSDSSIGRVRSSLRTLLQRPESGCAKDARSVEDRLLGSASAIRQWLETSWSYCTLEYRERWLAEDEAKVRESTRQIACQIARTFPELASRHADCDFKTGGKT